MEIYSTEEQQEEAIKKAIKDNWLVVVIGAAIGLGGVYGWRYYDAANIARQEADSDAYNVIYDKAGKEGADILGEAQQYIDSHDNKSYTVMAALLAAKEAVGKKDLATAAKQLQWALDNSSEESLKAVIVIRLSRIQAEQEKYDAALATLDNPLPMAFVASTEELKGDIYLKQDNKDKARSAYQKAADNGGLEGNNTLQLKIDELAQIAPIS